MKAIISKEKLPKFLVVNDEPEKLPYNKHLSKPYKKGEIVKVAPFEEQVRCDKYDDMFKFCKPDNDPLHFKNKYVVIYRKNDNGKFILKYIESWRSFNLLKKCRSQII